MLIIITALSAFENSFEFVTGDKLNLSLKLGQKTKESLDNSRLSQTVDKAGCETNVSPPAFLFFLGFYCAIAKSS